MKKKKEREKKKIGENKRSFFIVGDEVVQKTF